MARILEIEGGKCKDCDLVIKIGGILFCPVMAHTVNERELCSVGDDEGDYISNVTQEYTERIEELESDLEDLKERNSILTADLEEMTSEKEELEAQLSIEKCIGRQP